MLRLVASARAISLTACATSGATKPDTLAGPSAAQCWRYSDQGWKYFKTAGDSLWTPWSVVDHPWGLLAIPAWLLIGAGVNSGARLVDFAKCMQPPAVTAETEQVPSGEIPISCTYVVAERMASCVDADENATWSNNLIDGRS